MAYFLTHNKMFMTHVPAIEPPAIGHNSYASTVFTDQESAGPPLQVIDASIDRTQPVTHKSVCYAQTGQKTGRLRPLH